MMGSMGAVLMAWLAVMPVIQGGADDRIYGRVTLATGDEVVGLIRWDLNEGSWPDILSGTKELAEEDLEEARRLVPESVRTRSVDFMGVRISWEEDENWPGAADSGIRFGHLRALIPLKGDRVRLLLKNGEELELAGGSTDLGPDVRDIEVMPAGQPSMSLEWGEIRRIDFMPAPPGLSAAPRLFGTLEDRWGQSFTGYVAWDLDEILPTDVLDGDDESGRARTIPFGEIAVIERFGSRAARVTLRDGEELILQGSNDVDRGNRGIQISDPELGQVQVYWEEFESIRFHAAERRSTYDDFDGGQRLMGTVVTENGAMHRGLIRWDNDEKWGWEILDGEFRDVVFDVEFARIQRIERLTSRQVLVRLWDGRELELSGSNDVSRNNKGIFIELENGSTVALDWMSFQSVDFDDIRP